MSFVGVLLLSGLLLHADFDSCILVVTRKANLQKWQHEMSGWRDLLAVTRTADLRGGTAGQ